MNNGNYDRIMAEIHVIINFLDNNEIVRQFWIMSFREAYVQNMKEEVSVLYIGLS